MSLARNKDSELLQAFEGCFDGEFQGEIDSELFLAQVCMKFSSCNLLQERLVENSNCRTVFGF